MTNFEQGYHDGYNQGKADRASGELIAFIFGLFFKLLYYCFIYLPLILCAYWIMDKLTPADKAHTALKIAVFIFILYLLYCLVYFLKGMVIVLKVNKAWGWMPLWVLCVCFTCALQALFIKFQIDDWISRPNGIIIPKVTIWGWIGGLLFGILVYNRYQFAKDICPRASFWAYKIGFNTGLLFVKKPIDSTPDESDQFF